MISYLVDTSVLIVFLYSKNILKQTKFNNDFEEMNYSTEDTP